MPGLGLEPIAAGSPGQAASEFAFTYTPSGPQLRVSAIPQLCLHRLGLDEPHLF